MDSASHTLSVFGDEGACSPINIPVCLERFLPIGCASSRDFREQRRRVSQRWLSRCSNKQLPSLSEFLTLQIHRLETLKCVLKHHRSSSQQERVLWADLSSPLDAPGTPPFHPQFTASCADPTQHRPRLQAQSSVEPGEPGADEEVGKSW